MNPLDQLTKTVNKLNKSQTFKGSGSIICNEGSNATLCKYIDTSGNRLYLQWYRGSPLDDPLIGVNDQLGRLSQLNISPGELVALREACETMFHTYVTNPQTWVGEGLRIA